jgi:biotin carboxylase
MKKRILFVGGGDAAAHAVVVAGRLGYQTVAVDNTPRSPVIAAAQEGIAADIGDSRELTRVARSVQADGIYPAFEEVARAVATAAAELHLPGLTPDAVALMQDKYAMRRALAGSGVMQPTFCAAADEQEACAAAETVRLPVVVKPCDGSGSAAVRQVDHIEDMPLALVQAKRASKTGLALVESFIEGRHVTIDGAFCCGSFRPLSAHGSLPAPPPCCYDQAVYEPLEDELVEKLAAIAGTIAKAMKLTAGIFSAEFIQSANSFFLVELHPYPSHLRLPWDFIEVAGESIAIAGCLRACAGEAPQPAAPSSGQTYSAAICWIPTHSGMVVSVDGIQEARAVAGVRHVRVAAKPGDLMGHVVDAATRDRVGYAVAIGASAGEALDAAQKASNLCRIVTDTALR